MTLFVRVLVAGALVATTAGCSGGGAGDAEEKVVLAIEAVRVEEYYSTDPMFVEGSGEANPNTGTLTFNWTVTNRLAGTINYESEANCIYAWKWKDRGYSDIRSLPQTNVGEPNRMSLTVGEDVGLIEAVYIECAPDGYSADDLQQLVE